MKVLSCELIYFGTEIFIELADSFSFSYEKEFVYKSASLSGGVY